MERKHSGVLSKSTIDSFSRGHLEKNSYPNYVAAIKLDVGIVPKQFTPGLDGIHAFDTAEKNGPYIAQINQIDASSFCAPRPYGRVLGYDILRPQGGFSPHSLIPEGGISHQGRDVVVYSADSLYDVAVKYFGTNDTRRYPPLPGSHMIAAQKSIVGANEHLYCAVSVSIPETREQNDLSAAILFMEDVGILPSGKTAGELEEVKKKIAGDMVRSALAVAKNHYVRYSTVFVGFRDIQVPPGFVGCALVMNPYFALAPQAIPEGGYTELETMSIEDWENWQQTMNT